MHQRRQAGTERTDIYFAVNTHLFLRQLLTVLGIFLLNGLPLLIILQFLHGGRALHLLRVERPRDNADQYGKQDDGNGKILTNKVIDPYQYINKNGDKKIPHSSSLISWSKCPNLTTVLVKRREIEFGLQRSHQNEISRRDRCGVDLNANFLSPEHLASAVYGK